MAAAVDPTYPLFSVAAFSAAAMLFLVLLSRLARQSSGRGVTILCFWLLFENVTNGANFIIWSDNAEIKLYTYCDIGALTPIQTDCLLIL